MWYWIIKVSILSFIFIFLLHYIYSFFISTLTIPKVKDLVTLPQQKYDELFNSLHLQHNKFTNDIDINNNGNNLPASSTTTMKMQSAPKQTTQAMKDELIKFMKEISHNNNTNNANSNAVADNNAILSYSFSR